MLQHSFPSSGMCPALGIKVWRATNPLQRTLDHAALGYVVTLPVQHFAQYQLGCLEGSLLSWES